MKEYMNKTNISTLIRDLLLGSSYSFTNDKYTAQVFMNDDNSMYILQIIDNISLKHNNIDETKQIYSNHLDIILKLLKQYKLVRYTKKYIYEYIYEHN